MAVARVVREDPPVVTRLSFIEPATPCTWT